MLVKTKALVINTIRYQDKGLIVKCYTLSDGIKSYFVKNAFSSGKNKKIAYFQPLTLLEIVADHKNKNTLEYFKEIKPLVVYHSLSTNVIKSSLVIFLSEILHQTLKEEFSNEELFLFLESTLIWLDTHHSINDFHILFLIQYTKFLGIYPSISEGLYFDMHQGIFVDFDSQACLSLEDSTLLKDLLQLKFTTAEASLGYYKRQEVLEIILNYYQIHIDNFTKPKSLEILKEVFN